ncbi:lysophospholipid acyltransferase family protein [Salisediminibacterium halotolerans]|uniref:lysophospholipid acyltransferase family protein n=1 Tax=Salisediminibacterium halotolerans TaxID=517425 RepID=UPI000EAE4801|nr:lysophospholipid acyltransferase family protein [Salisediminibacterium halotolerans]RLJ78017.1 1-acyl-sn-glycerol-3-phosphate acyltransferase [Actinophytocola xinjiangensis]RPE88645.1 1-acyl-sn-glycerol-3-phosphate acyltransferase [Salisediminibacterium halotolerans]TWG36994.1 1-acyl-sn-glycerol-3-phosphate acyltransferase [Salisediminibacterium halotolerans]GEL08471.1 glycerol acyltransferase [Salisediminibacterium halotolerans]
MIKAAPNPYFEKLFCFYTKFLLQKHFRRIAITTDSYRPPPDIPAIYIINHSSWWDAIILFYLNQNVLQLNGRAMMSEDGLQRFPFFRKLGAFSIDSSSPKKIVASLQYAAEELQTGKHVFIFPQGDETPLEQRPVHFYDGTSYLLDKLPATPVIPIGFYHGLFHHQKPDWFIHIDDPIVFHEKLKLKEKTAVLESGLEKTVDTLRERILSGPNDPLFEPVLSGRAGVAERFEKMKKMLSRGGVQ